MPKRGRESTPSRAAAAPTGSGGKVKGGGAAATAGDGGEPFQEQQVTFKLSLLPHAMEDMGAHVQARLNGLLMKYHEAAGGVLLALSDLRLPKERGFATVMGDLPHLHLHVEATALVFAPRPGLALEGRVIKVARTHVALLVHGLFNAAVAKEDMGEGFRFHHPHDHHHGRGHHKGGSAYWVDDSQAGEERRMAVGDRVAFRVLRVHEAAGLIAMDGTLREGDEEEDKDGEARGEKQAAAGAAGSSDGGGGGKAEKEKSKKKDKSKKKEKKKRKQE